MNLKMKRILVIMAFLVTSCFQVIQGQDVEAFVTALMRQYPEARLLDIYKSCFQDYMGAEHLVNDAESARAYLEQELATTDADKLLPWFFEPCGVNGRYVRVSLKAVLDGKITADMLLDAFIASANDTDRPSVEQWSNQWHDIIAVIDGMGLNLPHCDEDRQFIEQVLAQGKYAISHSPEYREAYSPHYRIVRRDIFDRQLKERLTSHCCH